MKKVYTKLSVATMSAVVIAGVGCAASEDSNENVNTTTAALNQGTCCQGAYNEVIATTADELAADGNADGFVCERLQHGSLLLDDNTHTCNSASPPGPKKH